MTGDILAEWPEAHACPGGPVSCDGSNSVVKPPAWTYVPHVGHRERLRRDIAQFMKAYGRVADRNGPDPNDRHYSRRFESEIKRMRPEDLDRLLRDVDDAEDED